MVSTLNLKIINFHFYSFLNTFFPHCQQGFPRTLQQAKTLHLEENVNVVISLDVPAEEIIQRCVTLLLKFLIKFLIKSEV